MVKYFVFGRCFHRCPGIRAYDLHIACQFLLFEIDMYLILFKWMQFIDAFIQFSIHPVSISSCSSCHLNLLHYCCWRYALLFELQDFILFYMNAFGRCFYPKRLSFETHLISSCLPWDLNLWPWHSYLASI